MTDISMSASCLIPGNPDISGIGVRIAIYVQNFLCLLLALWALWDGKVTQSELAHAEMQTTTNLVLAFAILISSIVQALTLGMSSYHGTIVLLMSWMNNTNAFVYFILYIHHKLGLQKGKGGVDASWSSWIEHMMENFKSGVTASDTEEAEAGGVSQSQARSANRSTRQKAKVLLKRFALVLGSLHLTLMSILGIWLWSNPSSFGKGNRQPEKFAEANECALNAGLVAILGHRFPLHSAALRASSLVIYTLFLVPGFNLVMPIALFLGLYVVHHRWTQGVTDSEDTLPSPQQPKSEKTRWTQLRSSLTKIPTYFGLLLSMSKRWNAFPAFLGLGVLLVINVVFVIDIELALHGNQALQDQDEAAWGFGQTLAILLLLLPLRDLIEALLERRFRQRQRELDEDVQASVRKQDFDGVILALDRGGSLPTTGTSGYFAFWNLAYKSKAINDVNELRFNRMTFVERELDTRIFAAVQRQDFSAIASAYTRGADLITGVFHSAEAAAWILDHAVHSMNAPIRDCCVGFAGSHVNEIGRTGHTHLVTASRQGDESFVRLLLENPEIDINLLKHSPEFNATTPLIAALEGGHESVAKLLLDHPAIDPNAPNQAGDIPITYAARTDYRDGLLLLLQHPGVDVNMADARGQTALMQTSQNGYHTLTQMLLERPDIRVNLVETTGAAALTLASRMGHTSNVLSLLQHPDTEKDLRDGVGRTSWDWALSRGHASVLKAFLQYSDAYANAVDSRGYTPLMNAAELGHQDATQALLERSDAQPNATDSHGNTPLILASKEGQESVVQLLLEHSAIKLDLQDECKRTAWDWALHRAHISILQAFLQHSETYATSVDDRGYTPLMIASELGHEAVTQMLLERADTKPNSVDGKGSTALILASKEGREAVVRRLLKHSAVKCDMQDACKRTALDWALLKGHTSTLEVFIEHEAVDVNRVDSEGLTPLMRALRCSPFASIDECDKWLSENACVIEAAIYLCPPEDRPVARALARGIYPRLSLLTLVSISPLPQKHRAAIDALGVQCETSHIAEQIPYHQSVKNTLENILNEQPNRLEIQQVVESVMSIDVQHLAVRTLQMLADSKTRSRCLSAAQDGAKEQDLVDMLHGLLDIETFKPFRPIFLSGLHRFSKSTGRFPRTLIHNDVVVVESGTAVTSGAFGDVWRGVLRGQAVAMKAIRTASPKDIIQNYSKEGVIWSQLHHPNVVPFYGIYCWDNHPGTHLKRTALLSPWLDAGNIIQYLRHHPNMDKASLVLDIAQGLNYLHTSQPAIVHGDLKGNNILINSAGRACVADYGLSQLIYDACAWDDSPIYPAGGHPSELFTAPEVLFWEPDQEDRTTSVSASPPPKTTESDVYAFGCVCYQLYTGKPRFFDLDIIERLLAVRDDKKSPKPSDMSERLWESVEGCWKTLPQDRPTMAHFIELLAVENGPEVVPESGFLDDYSKRVWDGRPNPIEPLDVFQLNSGSRIKFGPRTRTVDI